MTNIKNTRIPLRELVKRIPFHMDFHLNRGDRHSSLYKNKKLNIVYETHVYFENGRPTGKSETCFYKDAPEPPAFNTLSELLKANKDIKEKACKLYGKMQKDKKPKHHFTRKECV